MELFMLISGYFAQKSLRRSFFGHIMSKGRQLLVPVISWASICCIVGYAIGVYDSFINELNSLFWFLKSLFICYLLFYAVFKSAQYFNTHSRCVALIGGVFRW